MQITRDMKMADVIHLNHLLLPVINRFGIELGFGDSTIQEVCSEKGVNVDFFLDIINAYHDENYFPEVELQSFAVSSIIKYLQKAHDNYLNDGVPEIESMIQNLVDNCSYQKENLELLKKFFHEYKKEITYHIEREEDVVYPYALSIEEAYETGKNMEEVIVKMKEYSMHDFINEHDDIEVKLYDLKNIIIKYLPPPKNRNLCNRILMKLFTLERDLNDHSRIEEKVMVPKVIRMENELLNRKNK